MLINGLLQAYCVTPDLGLIYLQYNKTPSLNRRNAHLVRAGVSVKLGGWPVYAATLFSLHPLPCRASFGPPSSLHGRDASR